MNRLRFMKRLGAHSMNTKKLLIVVALVAAVVAAGVAAVILGGRGADEKKDVAGSIRTTPDSFPNGIVLNDAKELGKVFWRLGTSTDELFITNNTGSKIYADFMYAELTSGLSSSTPNVASSSYRLVSGTTTLSAVNDFLNPEIVQFSATTSLLNWAIASTTIVGTSTDSVSATVARLGRRVVVALDPNEKVLITLLQGLTGVPSGGCNVATSTTHHIGAQTSSCEAATSTGRGFNVEGYIDFFSRNVVPDTTGEGNQQIGNP